ncbi:hypothetical protein K502DRAFT_343419 [Neoconidiobolus thromboides FSU 785]|nr:hypothetical protein K502DRAFT_343419 [Neoconidiobolus thromboides FSU 785]
MAANINKLSREDFRKQKDLEAARKAGTAPAELDEEGNEINPHIPQYISKAPWYLDSGGPSLKHQRPQKFEDKDKDSWYDKGATAGPAATKYRKGACQNCGAMTHKTKECVERPRKLGAKFTGKDIKPDEVIQNLEFNYDSKRDRWNGYDATEHDKLFKVHNMIEEARKKRKAKELDEAALAGISTNQELKKVIDPSNMEFGSSDDSDDDDEKYAEKGAMTGQAGAKSKTTVKNLRIREDIPKYLRNLDVDSAYYDPKSRSMRDNPTQDNPNEASFAGDNFIRQTGDASKVVNLQLYAWKEAEENEDGLHLEANPTQYELKYKKHLDEKEATKNVTRQSVLEKYGGIEHLNAPDRELLMAQTESYVEYSRTGAVIFGQEKAIPKTKYQEDAYPQNHTSVWGSYFEEGKWGYQCCHSFYKNAYCIPIKK